MAATGGSHGFVCTSGKIPSQYYPMYCHSSSSLLSLDRARLSVRLVSLVHASSLFLTVFVCRRRGRTGASSPFPELLIEPYNRVYITILGSAMVCTSFTIQDNLIFFDNDMNQTQKHAYPQDHVQCFSKDVSPPADAACAPAAYSFDFVKYLHSLRLLSESRPQGFMFPSDRSAAGSVATTRTIIPMAAGSAAYAIVGCAYDRKFGKAAMECRSCVSSVSAPSVQGKNLPVLPYVPSGHSSAVSVTTFSAVVTIAAGPATNAANGDTRLPTFGQAVIRSHAGASSISAHVVLKNGIPVLLQAPQWICAGLCYACWGRSVALRPLASMMVGAFVRWKLRERKMRESRRVVQCLNVRASKYCDFLLTIQPPPQMHYAVRFAMRFHGAKPVLSPVKVAFLRWKTRETEQLASDSGRTELSITCRAPPHSLQQLVGVPDCSPQSYTPFVPRAQDDNSLLDSSLVDSALVSQVLNGATCFVRGQYGTTIFATPLMVSNMLDAPLERLTSICELHRGSVAIDPSSKRSMPSSPSPARDFNSAIIKSKRQAYANMLFIPSVLEISDGGGHTAR